VIYPSKEGGNGVREVAEKKKPKQIAEEAYILFSSQKNKVFPRIRQQR
jgi:hypothetical protein